MGSGWRLEPSEQLQKRFVLSQELVYHFGNDLVDLACGDAAYAGLSDQPLVTSNAVHRAVEDGLTLHGIEEWHAMQFDHLM